MLGPPIPGGRVVRGAIVGLMLMEDEKGWDAKVVLSLMGREARPRKQLTERDQLDIASCFRQTTIQLDRDPLCERTAHTTA